MKKSQKINSSKPSNTGWKIFKSKTRIFTYFTIICIFPILWFISQITNWNNYSLFAFLFALVACIWQIIWKQERKKIFLEFNDETLKICDENKEITELKYSDINEVVFLKNKLLPMLWLLSLALLSSILLLLILLPQMDEDMVLLRVAICLPIIYFIFHTLPIIIFRKNCRSLSIITNDKTITLPKIKWEKELKQVLDEKNIKYSNW